MMEQEVRGNTNYNWAFPHVQGPIASIVEIGSRDGLDAITLGTTFQAPVTAFECDPAQYVATVENVRASGLSDITVLPYAVSDKNEPITFWQVDTSTYNVPGTSSLFEVNFDNRQNSDVDSGRAGIQHAVTVEGARFDSLGIAAPTLLAMDVQGAEVLALKGFGTLLSRCKYIVTEAERVPSYKGGNSFKDLDRFVRAQGFRLVATSIGSGTRLARWRQFLSLNLRIAVSDRTLFPTRKYQGCFDVLYVNSRLSGRDSSSSADA
ncbi:MAG TPA: hypothetical protein DDY88_05055 [Actinobacteria bacterium]|nr:hypothetical protein [Actinomycetota bacterium]